MKALIVVDMQNDFMPGGNLAVAGGDEIIDAINEKVNSEDYTTVVFTKDWHPVDHGSFASNHLGANPFEMGELNGKPQMLWPDHCVQNTWGAELHQDLEVPKWAKVICKGLDSNVDSYSAFYDNNKENTTGLSEYLKDLEVDEIDVVGLAADVCVLHTAKDALNEGFKTNIIWDLTKAVKNTDNDIKETMLSFRLMKAAQNLDC